MTVSPQHDLSDARILVTGGAGFIGSALVRHLLRWTGATVLNVDLLTYAGNLESVAEVADDPRYADRYQFLQADVADAEAMTSAIAEFRPTAIAHLAAESHVDRSIDGPAAFIRTNILGTFTLLEAALAYWRTLPDHEQAAFRFLHVSTDEVFGTLGPDGYFNEESPYRPNSPYSASKAGADHLARAWCHTYGLPVIVTNCSNNYGPFQYPEKLIPVVIRSALTGQPIPVYGQGNQVRDWLFVEDHARALARVLAAGRPGETYAIGGHNEHANIETVNMICALLDELVPESAYRPHAALITHVADRPGHDLRYAIDASKIARELGWRPQVTFAEGLRLTVQWYLDHPEWWLKGSGERLGLGTARAMLATPVGEGHR